MTEIFKKTLVCVTMAVLMLLTACSGGSATLEEMVANDEDAKAVIEAQCNDGQTVEVKDNSLIYTYKYEQVYKTKDLKKVKLDITKELENSRLEFQQAAAALKESSGLEKIDVEIVYLNSDGEEIYSEVI